MKRVFIASLASPSDVYKKIYNLGSKILREYDDDDMDDDDYDIPSYHRWRAENMIEKLGFTV